MNPIVYDWEIEGSYSVGGYWGFIYVPKQPIRIVRKDGLPFVCRGSVKRKMNHIAKKYNCILKRMNCNGTA